MAGLLQIENVSKAFGTHRAVVGVSLEIARGAGAFSGGTAAISALV